MMRPRSQKSKLHLHRRVVLMLIYALRHYVLRALVTSHLVRAECQIVHHLVCRSAVGQAREENQSTVPHALPELDTAVRGAIRSGVQLQEDGARKHVGIF